jgi:hypothetical protein
MTISPTGVDPANPYAVKVAKLALDQTRADGEAAVSLIESVPSAPPVGAEGQGRHVNTHA